MTDAMKDENNKTQLNYAIFDKYYQEIINSIIDIGFIEFNRNNLKEINSNEKVKEIVRPNIQIFYQDVVKGVISKKYGLEENSLYNNYIQVMFCNYLKNLDKFLVMNLDSSSKKRKIFERFIELYNKDFMKIITNLRLTLKIKEISNKKDTDQEEILLAKKYLDNARSIYHSNFRKFDFSFFCDNNYFKNLILNDFINSGSYEILVNEFMERIDIFAIKPNFIGKKLSIDELYDLFPEKVVKREYIDVLDKTQTISTCSFALFFVDLCKKYCAKDHDEEYSQEDIFSFLCKKYIFSFKGNSYIKK